MVIDVLWCRLFLMFSCFICPDPLLPFLQKDFPLRNLLGCNWTLFCNYLLLYFLLNLSQNLTPLQMDQHHCSYQLTCFPISVFPSSEIAASQKSHKHYSITYCTVTEL
uniref:Uncharacterized protein n=1 Tax=Lygus hesperus TaxID=30085 RepID=A0A146M0Z2_LYGHE